MEILVGAVILTVAAGVAYGMQMGALRLLLHLMTMRQEYIVKDGDVLVIRHS